MEKTLLILEENLKHAEHICLNLRNDPEFIRSYQAFVELLTGLFLKGGTVFICGNGGSHCDAMHFAEELTGRFNRKRRPLGALALGDSSHLTCVGNDFGFEHVFVRQIQALGRTGDVLVGISTSGISKNVILALESAKKQGLTTVGLLGQGGGHMKDIVDISILVPDLKPDRVQEAHIKIIHSVIEATEEELYCQNKFI